MAADDATAFRLHGDPCPGDRRLPDLPCGDGEGAPHPQAVHEVMDAGRPIGDPAARGLPATADRRAVPDDECPDRMLGGGIETGPDRRHPCAEDEEERAIAEDVPDAPHPRLRHRAPAARAGPQGPARAAGGGAMTGATTQLAAEIAACRLCADRFAATATAHAPRPVVWFRPGARLLIAGQAPGARVHASGRPFSDPSGARLRDWLGLDETAFYDRDRVAFVPMAFCFPGYDARGADLPPPPLCAATWRARVMAHLPSPALTVLVGGAAMAWHLGGRARVTARVRAWRDTAPAVFPLPHPSWRNTAWLRANPWFAAELLPALREAVAAALASAPPSPPASPAATP